MSSCRASSPAVLRPGDRGGDRAARPDPGRHGASLPPTPAQEEKVDFPWTAARGGAEAHARRAALPGAGDADRDRRRGLHARRGGPAAPGARRRSRTTARSTRSASGSCRAWRRTAIAADSPNGASPRSRASASYGFPESHAASFALLVYASAWLKYHHPAIFACALLNAQPMGFYAPAQIVRDARGARGGGAPRLHQHERLGQRDRARRPGGAPARLSADEGRPRGRRRRIVAARGNGYRDVAAVWWRAGCRGGRSVLVEADAFAGLGLSRRRRSGRCGRSTTGRRCRSSPGSRRPRRRRWRCRR